MYHGKGRLDKWYKLAKEKGYRARAAFKLIQLNKKYNFLEKSKVLIDLCAAPGSWCQVAAEVMPVNSLIVGVDLAPIKAIPRCITFQSDITTDKCRATLRQHLKTWKADTVLHDGAPNVGTAWVQDAYSQAELVLQSLRLATDFLKEGGTFVTKVFRSKDYNSLLWVFNQLFSRVEATKPPSSRNVSAEIFVVCRGFKAPKRIDSKFLDPQAVFAELADPTPNNEAKVFNPEKERKKRKRQGYEEGDWTQFKEAPASEFIHTTDPIAMLGSLNRLHFEQRGNGDIALATLDKLPETTEEIRECCKDLKVLGRKEFRILLRWRLRVRDIFGFSAKKKAEQEAQEAEGEEVAEVEEMDDELKIQEEMQRLRDQDNSRKRKERRKENERKQKDIVRMQLNMTTPMELGTEQSGPDGDGSMFALKAVDKAGALSKIAKGRMHSVIEEKKQQENDSDDDDDAESDAEEDHLETELDAMYEQYQERRSEADAKYRAKRARKEHEDGEWEGFSDDQERDVSSDEELVEDDDSDASSDEDDIQDTLTTDLQGKEESSNGLSRRAVRFFDQDIFKGIDGLNGEVDDDSGIDVDDESLQPDHEDYTHVASADSGAQSAAKLSNGNFNNAEDSDSEQSTTFEVVKRTEEDDPWNDQPEPLKNGRPDIDIITAEAMTLAQQLATGKRSKYDLIDDGFNKYSHRDTDGLPDWFLDDESQHSKPLRPISATAAAAIKEKLRALNARPIKKVREAKARKKFKAAQRLEKLKKKSAVLADEEGMSEKDKAGSIAKMMARAAKKKPKRQVKVVVARGGNRGIKGRPGGTKGRYKMVDARLKKDVRAEKRMKKARK
ncbi:hypothetical protein NA57DRAFT_71353 [Rhizodiscina lignyota]|uniref:AdoMet-dependent rRNA methyltransferase SPB1 n=1 Tax=Rhizodiscina lignyota TaxID=1504668 RepID=A0A9P4M9P6_9PEZI|nr:hypothetical protein NA57DRAFT_71353 [Rhizodiscina lignyota]